MLIHTKPSVIFAVISIILWGCTSQSNNSNANTSADPAIALPQSYDLGNLDLHIYEGISTDGSDYTLSVYNYRHSGDGLFSISILDKDNRLSFSSGKLYTLRGENDATIWECKDLNGETSYFLHDTTDSRIFHVVSDSDTARCNPLELVYSKIIR